MSETRGRDFPGDFAAGIASRVTKERKLEFLVIGVLPIAFQHADERTRMENMTVKFPGGCANNDGENENIQLALVKELVTEIGGGSEFRVCVGRMIQYRPKKSGIGGGSLHRQYFFMMDFRGPLRHEAMDRVEDEGDEVLSSPMWVEASELMQYIFFSHREPMMRVLRLISHEVAEIAATYEVLLADIDAGMYDGWALRGDKLPATHLAATETA